MEATPVNLHEAPASFDDVCRATEHRPSPDGSILAFEPPDTSTTGDRDEGEMPGHVDSTTGREPA